MATVMDIQSDGAASYTYIRSKYRMYPSMWATNSSTDTYFDDVGTASAVSNIAYKAYSTALSNSCYDDEQDGSIVWHTPTWTTNNCSTTSSTTTVFREIWNVAHGHEGYGCWGDPGWVKAHFEPPPLSERLSEIIRKRHAPAIHVNDRRGMLAPTKDIREQRARETMRRVLGEREYYRFVKCGFVSITGKSGLIYQIFPGHKITCVFNRGKLVDRLCVVLTGDFAPTDSLMMRYLMILNDEAEFRKHAIVHQVQPIPRLVLPEQPKESLVEIFKRLKQVA